MARVTVRRYTLDEALRVAAERVLDGTAYDPDHDTWAGGSMADALRWARDGRPDYVADLTLDVGAVARFRSGTRPAPVYDAVGSDLDVARYLARHPEPCIDLRRMQRPAPVLRLAVEIAIPGATAREDIVAQGRSILIAVESLRALGVSSEVWITASMRAQFAASEAPELLSYHILIQEAGRPVNAAVLAYWIMDPTALRRIVFALMEHESEPVRWAYRIHKGGGYGTCQTQTALAAAGLFAGYDEVAPRAPRFASAQIQEWIRDLLLRRGGIEILGIESRGE